MKLSGPNAISLALLGSSIILGGPWLLERQVKYNIQIVKEVEQVKVEPEIKQEPKPAVEIKPEPIFPIRQSNEEIIKRYTALIPSEIPDTRPWYYNGPGTLRDHIHNEHGVSYPAMGLFQTEADLKRLHSYLHNGGELDIR
jgi:hypothetical protein